MTLTNVLTGRTGNAWAGGSAGDAYPASNNTYTLGTSSFRWANVYSVLGNFSGALTVGSGSKIALDAASPTNRIIEWDTNSVGRWKMLADSTAEGGSNAGSDFALNRYDDAGASLGTSIAITRSTGAMTLGGASVEINGNVGFYATAPIAKPTVSGSRGGNAALASILTQLAALGLITDSTTA